MILAAGYATRLYPLTENFPKPLLEVGGKPILDWLIDDLESNVGKIEEYVVVSNHKFIGSFESWKAGHRFRNKLTLVDDGSISNETRLGAVKDIQLGIDKAAIDDDLLVMAGDNLLDFSLSEFVSYAERIGTSCIMRYFEGAVERLKKSGVALIDGEEKVLSLEEKPAEPKSNWCCPPFYFYKKEDLHLIRKGIDAGCSTDAPGSLVAWMCKETEIHAFEMPGPRYDIGNLESYKAVKAIFEAK